MLNSKAQAFPQFAFEVTNIPDKMVCVLQQQFSVAVLKGTKTCGFSDSVFSQFCLLAGHSFLSEPTGRGLHSLGGLTPGSEASARGAGPCSPHSLTASRKPAQACSHGCSASRAPGSDANFFKHLLMSHWPKQVMWPGPA